MSRCSLGTLCPTPPGGFNFTPDGSFADAWPFFPDLKVGEMYFYSFVFVSLVALIINRYSIVRLFLWAIGDWLELFSFVVFVDSVRVRSFVEWLRIMLVFVPHNFVWNNQFGNYFNLKELQQSATRKLVDQEEPCRHTAVPPRLMTATTVVAQPAIQPASYYGFTFPKCRVIDVASHRLTTLNNNNWALVSHNLLHSTCLFSSPLLRA